LSLLAENQSTLITLLEAYKGFRIALDILGMTPSSPCFSRSLASDPSLSLVPGAVSFFVAFPELRRKVLKESKPPSFPKIHP